MFSQRALLRVGVLSFLLFTLFAPIGAGARSVDCDDFANPEAAQYLLDIDDSHADTLDPDGDGIACNGDDASQESGNELVYIDELWEEIDRLADSFVEFKEIHDYAMEDETTGDDFQAAAADLYDISEMWVAYPDEAPEFDVPAGYEHIDEAYTAFIDSVSEAGLTWQTFVNNLESDDVVDNLETFNDAYIAAQEQAFSVMDLIVEAEDTLGQDAPVARAVPASRARE